jgi:hypothetical protein
LEKEEETGRKSIAEAEAAMLVIAIVRSRVMETAVVVVVEVGTAASRISRMMMRTRRKMRRMVTRGFEEELCRQLVCLEQLCLGEG